MDNLHELGVYLRELNFLSMCVRFMLAVIIGGIIGIDRSRKKRAAGLKTHVIVCLSSTLIMTLSLYINENYGTSGDITRLGAQVISGIGFLGAGTIILTGNNKVKGLTTAASLWASACIGLSIGIGFYEGAILASILIIAVMVIFKNSNEYFEKNSQIVQLSIEVENTKSVVDILQKVKESKAKIIDIQAYEDVENDSTILLSIIKFSKNTDHSHFIQQLNNFDGIMVNEIDDINGFQEF